QADPKAITILVAALDLHIGEADELVFRRRDRHGPPAVAAAISFISGPDHAAGPEATARPRHAPFAARPHSTHHRARRTIAAAIRPTRSWHHAAAARGWSQGRGKIVSARTGGRGQWRCHRGISVASAWRVQRYVGM